MKKSSLGSLIGSEEDSTSLTDLIGQTVRFGEYETGTIINIIDRKGELTIQVYSDWYGEIYLSADEIQFV